MMAIPRSLLLRFSDDAHTFAPEATTTAAYGWFNDIVVPALEHLQARGYLHIEERVPNALFSPGGRWAACTCRLTPTGRAARALLVARTAQRAHAPAAHTPAAHARAAPGGSAVQYRRDVSNELFG